MRAICNESRAAGEPRRDCQAARGRSTAEVAASIASAVISTSRRSSDSEIASDDRLLQLRDAVFQGFRTVFPRETEGMHTPPRMIFVKGGDVNAFVGYDDEDSTAVLELTYNYGVERYDLGSAFGHIAIGVPDVKGACERVRKSGGKVTREAGPVKGGTSVIAFVEDPDGYKIEFIETQRT